MASYVVMRDNQFLTFTRRWSNEFPDAELFDYNTAVYLADKYGGEPIDKDSDE